MRLFKKHWFLLALMGVFILIIFDTSGSIAKWGQFLKNHHGANIVLVLLFFFSGLGVDAKNILSGLMEYKSIIAALGVIFIAAPILGAFFSFLPIDQEILMGLMLVAAMPSTLSSGVVLTGKAGGNIVTALMITSLASIIALITIPITLDLLLGLSGQSSGVVLDKTRFITKMAFFVLLPLFLGIGLRHLFSTTLTPHNRLFSLSNQFLVLCMVWIAASGARTLIIENTDTLPQIVLLVFFFHGILLCLGFFITKLCGIGTGKRESVIFMGGQKTLPLCVMLQMSFFSNYPGMLLVCVIHHAVHLMMDGWLAGILEQAALKKTKRQKG